MVSYACTAASEHINSASVFESKRSWWRVLESSERVIGSFWRASGSCHSKMSAEGIHRHLPIVRRVSSRLVSETILKLLTRINGLRKLLDDDNLFFSQSDVEFRDLMDSVSKCQGRVQFSEHLCQSQPLCSLHILRRLWSCMATEPDTYSPESVLLVT